MSPPGRRGPDQVREDVFEGFWKAPRALIGPFAREKLLANSWWRVALAPDDLLLSDYRCNNSSDRSS